MRDRIRSFLELLGRHPGGLTLRRAARLLGVPREEYREFRRDVLRILRQDQLRRDRGRFLLPGAAPAQGGGRSLNGERTTPRPQGDRLRAALPAAFQPASVETERALGMKELYAEFGLEAVFPPAVEREARASADAAPAEEPGREAQGGLRVLCIDPADARDHDDAISLEPLPGGGWRLGVHIADVSAFVAEGGALDREARRRGNSTYFYLDTVPMLPPLLSGQACSLSEGEDRAAMSVFMDLDADTAVRRVRVVRSRLRVTHAMSYEDAEAALLAPGNAEPAATLRAMDALASRLAAARAEGGALQFELPEIRPRDRGEGVEAFAPVPVLRSHHIVEEFMLAANHAVGRLLRERGRPALYRVHPPPSPDDVSALVTTLQHRRVAWRPGRVVRSADFQRLAQLLADRPDRQVLLMKLLRAMAKAVYAERDDGHFGLAWRDYLHFTSPIRRYADLEVHRTLKALMDETRGHALEHDFAPETRRPSAVIPRGARGRSMAELAGWLSDCELNSLRAERESLRLEMVLWARQRLGESFEAELAAVFPTGLLLRLPESGVEGFLPAQFLGREYFVYDEEREELRGEHSGLRFREGDRLPVRLVDANLYTRRLQFLLERDGDSDDT